MLNPEKIWHENLTRLSISPVRCSYFTLVNPKKSFSTCLFIHTSDYFYVISEGKQAVIHWPTLSKNVTTLTCELQNFFIWLKVCCVFSNVGRSDVGSCLLSSQPPPPPRSIAITSRLRFSQILPKVYTHTKRYCSFMQYGLNHYQ